MGYSDLQIIDNIFPQFTYVAERKCTSSWRLQGKEIYDRHNLILVYDGEATLTCNNQQYNVSKGNLVYYKPLDYRTGQTNPNNLMKCFSVDFLYTCPLYQNDKWDLLDMKLPFTTVEKIDDSFLFSRLLDLFSKFTKTWLSGAREKCTRGRTIFLEMLSLLLQWKCNPNFNYDTIRKTEQIINYLTENYSSQIKLAELANHVGISSSYLGSLFKEVTGKSPISYLIDIRVHKAKDMLLDGYSVAETAFNVGFNDIYYFSKCFKKNAGVNPSKYRFLYS
ncbi:AraC family transcriptional regulator [Peribacillus butanolivorans]|uniref:AraC family transcriptional regulator n=1 Tax=Peribacillus butanolivorans TaxID=421767 RepID=UPI00366AE129